MVKGNKSNIVYFGADGQWTWPPSPPIQEYRLPPLNDPRWNLSPYDMNPVRQALQIGWIVHPDGYHFMIDMAEWRKLTNYLEAKRRREVQDANMINEAREHFRLRQIAQDKIKRKRQEEEEQVRLLHEGKRRKLEQSSSRASRASRRGL